MAMDMRGREKIMSNDEIESLFKKAIFVKVNPSRWHLFIRLGWITQADWVELCRFLPRRASYLRELTYANQTTNPPENIDPVSKDQALDNLASEFGGYVVE